MEASVESRSAESAVRAIASAAKALRLYPPTSPIPRQSIDDAIAALRSAVATRSVLPLVVGRTGFDLDGTPLAEGAPGVSDLADTLRAHGVAELDVLPGCPAEDLVTLLDLIGQEPSEVHASGGLATLLAAEGAEGVRVAEVALSVVSAGVLELGETAQDFLRELAADTDKLAAWLAAAAAGDPAGLAEGLSELANAAGTAGAATLAANIAEALRSQGREVRDAVLGCAMDPGPIHELARASFSNMGGGEIADVLCGGVYGENMLSLSNALTHLPLQQRVSEIRTQIQDALASAGHTEKEAHFLDHMLEVRTSPEPETALPRTELYGAVARALSLDDEDIRQVREATQTEVRSSDAAGVRAMLVLLDQQNDFELYVRSADSLAAMVPRLIEGGRLDVATQVIRELADRGSRTGQPWPELADRLRTAIDSALSPRTAEALIAAVEADPGLIADARTLTNVAPGSSGGPLLAVALTRGERGVATAKDLLGRKLPGLIAAAIPTLPWHQLQAAVHELAATDEPRFNERIAEAARRADEQSRREVAAGLASAGTPGAVQLLTSMVRDASIDVSIIAVRAMGKHRTPGAAALLAERLNELDLDGNDFLLGREIIGALARSEEPAALTALNALASRRALIKRGHFTEVQQLARQALKIQGQKGGS